MVCELNQISTWACLHTIWVHYHWDKASDGVLKTGTDSLVLQNHGYRLLSLCFKKKSRLNILREREKCFNELCMMMLVTVFPQVTNCWNNAIYNNCLRNYLWTDCVYVYVYMCVCMWLVRASALRFAVFKNYPLLLLIFDTNSARFKKSCAFVVPTYRFYLHLM